MGLNDLTLGPTLLGTFLNTYLYGLVTYQFSAYYQTKFNDRLAVKCMVLFLFVVDTFHSASSMYMIWNDLVTNYDNPASLGKRQWSYTITPICTAFTALVTQMYLGFRIWRLSDSKILFGVVVLLAISSFVLGFACGIEIWVIRILSELPTISPLVVTWLATQTAADVFITVTLVIVFSRSRTGFRRMDTVLNRLIRGAIQTGLFSGIFSLAALISLSVLPSTALYGMFAIPVGRIYTNTLLHSLLSRQSLKAKLYGTYDVSKELGSINWGAITSSQATPESQSGGSQRRAQSTIQQTRDPSTGESSQGKVVLLAV